MGGGATPRQPALTVTLWIAPCSSAQELAALSTRLPIEETSTAIFMSGLVPIFAHLLRLALGSAETVEKPAAHCEAKHIRLSGTLGYLSMLLAASSCAERIDEERHKMLKEL